MFSNNLVAFGGYYLIYLCQYLLNGDDTLYRIFHDPQIAFDTVMIGLSGALGQIFIFFTISLFNCYYLTIITTTRKLFSVFLSSFEFNHHFTPA
jgi:hypothetical protein